MPIKKTKKTYIEYPADVIARYYKILELFSHPSIDAVLEEQTRMMIEQDRTFCAMYKLPKTQIVSGTRTVSTPQRMPTNDERNIAGGYLEGMKGMSLATLLYVVKDTIKKYEAQERDKKK